MMNHPGFRKFFFWTLFFSILGTAPAVLADSDHDAVVVTASNATKNQLLVYDSNGKLIQTVSTGGQGGVSGNAGGIEANSDVVAVVNFGSQNVSIFERRDGGFHLA